MQVVIDMPEAYYECLMNTSFTVNLDLWCKQSAKDKQQTNAIFALINALHNGKPLTEHHSELVDKKEVYKKFYSRCLAKVATEVLSEVTTIIPATNETECALTGCARNDNGRCLDGIAYKESCYDCYLSATKEGDGKCT